LACIAPWWIESVSGYRRALASLAKCKVSFDPETKFLGVRLDALNLG